MSPDGIFTSLKREVINRKPHLLKIPLLFELRNLFPEGKNPFYAGFGNRETDAIAYRYLNIPLIKIFIIDTSSKVIQLGNSNKVTYRKLAENIDINFPRYGENKDNADEIEINTNFENEGKKEDNETE